MVLLVQILLFILKNYKNAQIYSLDNLIRNGSRLNRNRLKKAKIKNYNFDIKKNDNLKNCRRLI